MPYLTQFSSDLFISYSHLDNQDDSPWVTRLHKDLERRLNQYLGSAVAMWRDSRLQGNDYLTPAIEQHLKRVAVMVSVVSPRYFQSDWCRQELNWFLDALGPGRQRAGARSRLFKVVPTPVDPVSEPTDIQDLLGYHFYRVDEARGTPRRLPDRDPQPDAEKLYLAKLDDLAYDIHGLLKELAAESNRGASNGASSKAAEETGPGVYLAETSSDLSAARDQIRRELLAQKCRVFPESQLPRESSELAQAVSRDLESCALSIHMIGSRYGYIPDGSTRSVVWLQQELAVERRSRGDAPRCILWMPAGLEVTEEWQRKTIAGLQDQLKDHHRFELLSTPLEGLRQYVLDCLSPAPAKPAVSTARQRKRVYVICEPRDFEAVEPARKALSAGDALVDLPLREGSQQEIRLEHEAALQECDAVLIYWGAGSEGWVREKLRELRKARGLGRSREFAPAGILIAPEATESKQTYANPELIVMKHFGPFSSQSLGPFADELAGNPIAMGAPQ